MNPIDKFLNKLSQKERDALLILFQKIRALELVWLDVKKMQWDANIFRVRRERIRIIFRKENSQEKLLDVDYRGNIY
jgi:mRNA-degrading endonuclease RelE of RelBE toxin-antitoxin system